MNRRRKDGRINGRRMKGRKKRKYKSMTKN